MKAESTIRKTMQRLRKEDKESNSEERCQMAFDMAIALQWVIEDTSWNPVSILKEETNGSSQS